MCSSYVLWQDCLLPSADMLLLLTPAVLTHQPPTHEPGMLSSRHSWIRRNHSARQTHITRPRKCTYGHLSEERNIQGHHDACVWSECTLSRYRPLMCCRSPTWASFRSCTCSTQWTQRLPSTAAAPQQRRARNVSKVRSTLAYSRHQARAQLRHSSLIQFTECSFCQGDTPTALVAAACS